jgi:hypothetical protein
MVSGCDSPLKKNTCKIPAKNSVILEQKQDGQGSFGSTQIHSVIHSHRGIANAACPYVASSGHSSCPENLASYQFRFGGSGNKMA